MASAIAGKPLPFDKTPFGVRRDSNYDTLDMDRGMRMVSIIRGDPDALKARSYLIYE